MQMTKEIEQAETQMVGVLPETLRALEQLSWNYWWSWAEDGGAVFRDLDSEVWEEVEHNPRRLLRETAEFRMMKMATDPVFIKRVEKLAASFDRYMDAAAQTWARTDATAITQANPVAYFCAEFGVHQSLPLYSGGLGMLAGDHLKSASDLGLPLVAVGLLYRHGYFRQHLRRDGWQEEHYGEIDTDKLPIRSVLDEAGAPLQVELLIRGRKVIAGAWLVKVGRIKLYLLDTNLDENHETDRLITGHLYGGDRETRCVQEMVLGVGGIRLLRKLNVEPHVFHLNEGHSAFLTLELSRELTEKGRTFAEAAQSVRERCVFTTHARPRFRKISIACSSLPSASFSAFLHSIIPAPVFSRSALTAAAVISAMSINLLKKRIQEPEVRSQNKDSLFYSDFWLLNSGFCEKAQPGGEVRFESCARRNSK